MSSKALDLIRARRAVTPARRKQVGPIPRQLLPTGVQLDYYAALKPLLAMMRDTVARRLTAKLPEIVERAGIRADGPADDDFDYGSAVAEAVGEASAEVERGLSRQKMADIVRGIARKTSTFGRRELAKQFKAGLGIDVMTLEPWLPKAIEGFTAENVSLIKSIPQQFFAQVESEVIKGIRAGRRHERLAESIQERFSVSESRARLIARDQVNKFNGELNRARQSDLGITHFVWRTVGDNRVREKHEHLNGRRFSLKTGANGLFPGQDVQCRCTAEPDIEGAMEALASR
jgi:SPP1 gp7 family putative phage head morphogenesis protein